MGGWASLASPLQVSRDSFCVFRVFGPDSIKSLYNPCFARPTRGTQDIKNIIRKNINTSFACRSVQHACRLESQVRGPLVGVNFDGGCPPRCDWRASHRSAPRYHKLMDSKGAHKCGWCGLCVHAETPPSWSCNMWSIFTQLPEYVGVAVCAWEKSGRSLIGLPLTCSYKRGGHTSTL